MWRCRAQLPERDTVESIVITWRELLLVVALILAVYIAEMLLLMRTGGGLLHRRRTPEALPKPPEPQSDGELRAELDRMGSRLLLLEKQIEQMQAEHMSEATPYNRAIQLARQGRDAARISESCGISRGEAELIVSMHGPHE